MDDRRRRIAMGADGSSWPGRLGFAGLLLAVGLLGSACADPSPFEEPFLVGVATDNPGLNQQDQRNRHSGFEADLYRWMANTHDEDVDPLEIDVSVQDRETILQKRDVDMVIASYSITEARDKKIDFAGPYLETKQGIMVRADDPAPIGRPEDLVGRTVCAQTGSTSVQELQAIPGVIVEERVALNECVTLLAESRVAAVSTDQLLLLGYTRDRADLRVLDVTFGALQKYGVGLPPEDGTDTCEIVTEQLRQFIISKAWDAAFVANFGTTLDPADYRLDPARLRPCVADEE